MKNYQGLYIIIIIGLFFVLIFNILQDVEKNSKNHQSNTTTLQTITNTTPNTSSLLEKSTMIINPKSLYYAPEPFMLENYDKFYNFVISDFTSAELYNIENSHIIFEPSDLLLRSSKYLLKSILSKNDIDRISQIVYYLRSKNNNIGAYMTISSLEKDREDVNLLFLEPDVDYSTACTRVLMTGEEYLPIGNPTQQYEAFMQYRLSQIKRCGFNFVQLGVIDPLSIINYQNDCYETNYNVDIDKFRDFILRILAYCNMIELKICIQDFPSLFNHYEQDLLAQIHYTSIFKIDARTFNEPTCAYKTLFNTLPIFLNTVLCNNVIENFIKNTDWPEDSVLFEMSIFGVPLPTPDLLIKCLPQIKWCPYVKRWWKIVPPSLPPVTILIQESDDETRLPLFSLP